MYAIIPRQSIQDGKANGTSSKDLRTSSSRCSSTCIHSLSSYSSLHVRKPVGILTVQFIPSLEKENSLFWLLHPLKDMQIFMVENWFCIYIIWGTYKVLFHQIKIGYFICTLVIRQFIVIFYLTQNVLIFPANLYNFGKKFRILISILQEMVQNATPGNSPFKTGSNYCSPYNLDFQRSFFILAYLFCCCWHEYCLHSRDVE
jgi:hypothetical protein